MAAARPAGAINLITRKPDREFGGYLTGELRQLQRRSARRRAGRADLGRQADGALCRQVRPPRRLSASTSSPGNQIDNRDAYALRGTHPRQAQPRISRSLISGEYFNENDSNYAFHYFGPTVAPENLLGSILGGQSLFTVAAAAGRPAEHPQHLVGSGTAQPRATATASPARSRGTRATSDVKSITSYRKFKRFNRDDLDASERQHVRPEQLHREQRRPSARNWSATYKTDKLDLLVGAMYFHENLYGEVRVPLTNLAVLLKIAGQVPPATPDNAFDRLELSAERHGHASMRSASTRRAPTR